jgi:hypothetical protein
MKHEYHSETNADHVSAQPTTAVPGQKAPMNDRPKRKRSEKEGQNMERVRITDKWIAAATVVIALTTIVQGYEMVTGSGDTHKLAESTLAASRAWVVVQGTGFEFTKDKNFPRGVVALADSGNSPAFGLHGWRCVEIRGDEPPLQDGRLQKSPTAVCLSIAGGTLGNGIPIKMSDFVPTQVPANFSKDTEGVGPHFYFWGLVTYDIYPSDGKRHSTSFCLRNGGNQLSACSEGGYEAN